MAFRAYLTSTTLAVIFFVSTIDQAVLQKWSPSEENAGFEPSPSLLEQWSELKQPISLQKFQLSDMFRTSSIEREDKVMKKPVNPDRIINKPPINGQDISETDFFLLGAIEKLAHRMDFLEKRTKQVEDMLYQLLAASTESTNDSCPEGFFRQNGFCYHVSANSLNWKSASSMCRSMGGVLIELKSESNRKKFAALLQMNPETQGNDFWTGGLNPGLLWLWGSSAKPISSNTTQTDIAGNGRCLLLAYQPPNRSYQYKGSDCSTRHRYICQVEDNTTERKLQRLLRNRNIDI